MAYSCSDFTDDIIQQLGIDIPEYAENDPHEQARLAMAEIGRLQRYKRALCNIHDICTTLEYDLDEEYIDEISERERED